jgi:alkaline phosphatase D
MVPVGYRDDRNRPRMPTTRRRFLELSLSLPATVMAPPAAMAAPVFRSDPFRLGVASGYPTAQGVTLWTRLAPDPLAPGAGMTPEDVSVRWEIAADERFRRILKEGRSRAQAAYGHSVHVDVAGLAPERWYWYRFHAGAATSPIARTRTAPRPQTDLARVRFAFTSCQHYEQGYFVAYRPMLADAPDFILHLGDYIYESHWGVDLVRAHEAGEPETLDQYRARYACYKTDPDLQAAHAACPWMVVWDDHEVDNDYANDRSQDLDDPVRFLARRAAAYQAYYEHMPLPRAMRPRNGSVRLHAHLGFGRLLDLYLLDDRQYRSYQPCPRPGRGGGNNIENCAQRSDPRATLLGPEQERWLERELRAAPGRWNVLAQQTLMAQADSRAGPGERYYSDGWDGYPAARTRLLATLDARRIANPVVLGGDVHSFWVTDLKSDFADPRARTVATEFVTTSLTSQPIAEQRFEVARREEPHVRYATGLHRGYTRVDLTRGEMRVDLRAVASVTVPDPDCRTLASFRVESGRPGAQPA